MEGWHSETELTVHLSSYFLFPVLVFYVEMHASGEMHSSTSFMAVVCSQRGSSADVSWNISFLCHVEFVSS